MLRSEQWGFDELRAELALTVKVLEEDLRHIRRSVRPGGERLVVGNARCAGCGFEFTSKALHPPGRCPQCRDRRIDGPWFEIVG